MSRDRLSGLDAVFLAAEQPGHPLHMMGVLLLDPSSVPGGYDFEGFRSFLAQWLPALPPLRRRLLEVPGGLAPPRWLEVPEIDVRQHVRRAAAPSPGGPRELSLLTAEMLERPLDRSRPLWEMTLVEGLEGGRLALLAKLHHATMDGMAGMALMASLFTPTPEIALPPPAKPADDARVPGRLELLADAVPWLLQQPLRSAAASLYTARRALRRLLPDSGPPPAAPVHVPRSWLNVQTTPQRAVAYQSLPLEGLRAASRPLGATLNDALLAVVAGALRRYLDDRGVLSEEPLVAGVPVTVREAGDERANAVQSVAVGLATDVEDPVERLRRIRDAMAERKQRRGEGATGDLAAWVEVPPPAVFHLLTRLYLDFRVAERIDPLCNLIVSSVPGPATDLYLGGARLEGIYPLGPIYSGLALNVTAIGCGDAMDVGLVACGGRMPDLWKLAEGLPAALAELRSSVVGAPLAAATAPA